MTKNIDDYAVVIGVSHYKGLSKLQGPEEDAQAIYNWLLSNNGGNLPDENCHLICSTEDPLMPIQDSIDNCFATILKSFRDKKSHGRRLYFYFSGHGFGVEWNETALVLPPWTDILRNYALSSSGYLTTLIQSGYFQQVFFFLDCCRNRMVGVNGAQPLFANIKPANGTGSCISHVFSATEFDNKAFEAVIQPGNGSLLDNNRTRGLFTVSLMNGLNGGAVENGRVTTASLTDYLKLNLPEMAKAVRKIQIPRFHSENDGNEVIIVDGFSAKEITLQINFTTPDKYIFLEDSNLNTVHKGNSDTGPWSIILAKGLYSIYCQGEENHARSVRIDGTQNPASYEF
jgi:hypothetical protein